MDEQQIPIAQLRQELTERSGGKPSELAALDSLLSQGVIVTAWVDRSQQRYLCGEIGGPKFTTKRAGHFSYAMLEELVKLVTPSIYETEHRRRGPQN